MVENEHLIDLKHICKNYDGVTVLDDINLYIRKKEFVTLLGPSGCGKTTTLRIIGGFETADEGEVIFMGEVIGGVPPHKRNVNTVVHRCDLVPHLNLFQHLTVSLPKNKLPKDEIKRKLT